MAVVLGLGGYSGVISPDKAIAASKLEELNNQKSEIENKQSNINSKLSSTDNELTENQNKQSSVESEIKRLDSAISDTQSKIDTRQSEIKETKNEIKKLKGEIKVLMDRIEKRNELLKDRARSFQESGGMVSYMDVLMGSQSFSDFIDRMGAVATIVEADQDILKEHMADKKLLEEKEKQVEKELAKLETLLAELKSMEKSLNSQKNEKDKLMASLKEEEHEIHEEKLALEEEQELLSAQKSAIQKAMQLEKQRQAELAAAAAAAARQEAQERVNNNNNSNSSSGSSSSNSSSSNNNSGSTVSAPAVSSGAFTRPAAGRLTSGFGQRWGDLHAGIDIAASGTVPIVSAADGVVIRSYYSSSYGNVIFISHSINGQVYTTVYAHLSSRSVGAGASVSKGQHIGYMGNTGQSYGQHLHFELHRGPWNAAKSNAINPVGIVPL